MLPKPRNAVVNGDRPMPADDEPDDVVVRTRIELVVAEADLVVVGEVEIGPEQVALGRRQVGEIVERAGVVTGSSADRNELSAVRSDASTRVTVPATGSPPLFARNVVSGRLSSSFS